MKPIGLEKQDSGEAPAEQATVAEAVPAAPAAEEKIDFSNIVIEPLFEDQVDFETFSKSDFRAVKVLACKACNLRIHFSVDRIPERMPI